MTLLFYLRSPAGNTDTAQAPDAAPLWDYEQVKREAKRKTRKEKEAERQALLKLSGAVTEADQRKRRRRKDEEILLMLMEHLYED